MAMTTQTFQRIRRAKIGSDSFLAFLAGLLIGGLFGLVRLIQYEIAVEQKYGFASQPPAKCDTPGAPRTGEPPPSGGLP